MNWFKRIRRANEPIRPDDKQLLEDELRDWRIVTANNSESGKQATIRIRMRKPPLPDGLSFSTAIEISWPFNGAGQYPSEEVNQEQLAFETALDDLSGMNGFSELVQVSTGAGVKEWLYYTCNQDRFMKVFNTLLSSHEPYPIEIKFYEDPEWQIWSETVQAMETRNV